jgi:hypothetical protein
MFMVTFFIHTGPQREQTSHKEHSFPNSTTRSFFTLIIGAADHAGQNDLVVSLGNLPHQRIYRVHAFANLARNA